MKKFIAVIEVKHQYGEHYWLKSLNNESLQEFKKRVMDVYSDSHVEFYELRSMI